MLLHNSPHTHTHIPHSPNPSPACSGPAAPLLFLFSCINNSVYSRPPDISAAHSYPRIPCSAAPVLRQLFNKYQTLQIPGKRILPRLTPSAGSATTETPASARLINKKSTNKSQHCLCITQSANQEPLSHKHTHNSTSLSFTHFYLFFINLFIARERLKRQPLTKIRRIGNETLAILYKCQRLPQMLAFNYNSEYLKTVKTNTQQDTLFYAP